ncbi:MAG: hypothetical protein NC131_08225 [Roseburia sp.]|nr:hypothetical protein [Roseburia sp.]
MAATLLLAWWAGAGSLMNSTTLAHTLGVVPAMIWCLFNTLACIVFGLIIHKLPTVREIMRTRVCRLVLALFSIFQIWLCMTAVNEAWASTALGKTAGLIFTYAITALFIVALYRKGIIANILTDNGGMWVIYALVVVLYLVSMVMAGDNIVSLPAGTEPGNILQGLYKGFLLLPGPFTYPYFFKLVDYNESNGEGAKRVDITKAFIYGGVGFGVYLFFAFALIFTDVSPVLGICKAILLSVLAISSLSSFIYSEFAVFGKRVGLGINIFALAFWIVVAPLGVMGVWTLMAESRVYLVLAMLLVALAKRLRDRKGARV